MKKIISITLSILLLLGNLGVTYGAHFCGGHAVIEEVMLGQKHLDCGMAMMDMTSTENEETISSPDCCSNEYVSSETGDAVKQQVSTELTPSLFMVALAYVVLDMDWKSVDAQSQFIATSPPLPDVDLNTLHQVFLI